MAKEPQESILLTDDGAITAPLALVRAGLETLPVAIAAAGARSWTDQAQRCQAAGIPLTVAFATKPMLVRQPLQSALDVGVPAGSVTGDAVYGSDSQFRHFLESRHLAYALGVASDDALRPYTVGTL